MFPTWYEPPQKRKPKSASAPLVIAAVSKIMAVSVEDLKSPSRAKKLCMARHTAYYMMRRHCHHLSYQRIAYSIGRTDHTTVMHGCAVIDDLLRKDKKLVGQIDAITKVIERANK
jgi:chromosomal replication initiator protein